MNEFCKIYGASRASNPARVEMWKNLKKEGANIISSWIEQVGPVESYSNLWSKIVAEINMADVLVLYVEPKDFPLKGAFVEAGIALALGKKVIIVAPNVNINPLDYSPIGSWAYHPLVSFEKDVKKAVFLKLNNV